MDVPADDWRAAAHPEMIKAYDKAVARWQFETSGGKRPRISDPMVSTFGDAVHYWCDLPLIRAALSKSEGR